MSSAQIWCQKATYDTSGQAHTFEPEVAVDTWQLRLINGSGANSASVTVETVDEDGALCEVSGSPYTIGTSSGQEITVLAVDPSLKVTITGTNPSVTVKCKAWSDSDWRDPRTYGAAVAAA